MSRFQKIRSILFALVMMAAGLIIILEPDKGYRIVISILGVWLLFYGIGTLIYFFSMARHMVGGKIILYKGIILTDFGYLSASIVDVPRIYVLGYLIIIHAFSGLVEILRAFEQRRYGAGMKMKLTHGIVNILLALACVVFIKRPATACIIYGIGIIYSACMRIGSALRKTESKNIEELIA